MARIRVEAEVIGPAAAGGLRIRLGEVLRDVASELVPLNLRMPNSRFVAVCEHGQFVGVESRGVAWLEIQEAVRAILNGAWDPIGVADSVSDEYDGYIADIYSLLQQGASPAELAAYLGTVESERMGLPRSPEDQRLDIAEQLRELKLPSV